MADEERLEAINPGFAAALDRAALLKTARLDLPQRLATRLEGVQPVLQPGARVQPPQQPPTLPVRAPAPLPSIPRAPESNPLEALPFPEPGERIRADDFKALSRSLGLVRDAFALSGKLFGRTFGQVRQLLTTEKYDIRRVMTVFGTEVVDLNDVSLDSRKVIQVLPVELGGRQVAVVVTEAVDTRRFMPNLVGLTYKEASQRIQDLLGDVSGPGVQAGQFVGLSLAEAQQVLSK
jgi:hypothetical protein